MDKRVRKDIKDFYEALNEFFDWIDSKDEKKVSCGLVGAIPKLSDCKLMPIGYAEMVPTLDDTAEIHKALANGDNFNVEFLTGDILRESFIQEKGFRYQGKFEIRPFRLNDILHSGFEIDLGGNTVRNLYYEDILYDDEELLLRPYRWDDYAEYVAEEAEDAEEEYKKK